VSVVHHLHDIIGSVPCRNVCQEYLTEYVAQRNSQSQTGGLFGYPPGAFGRTGGGHGWLYPSKITGVEWIIGSVTRKIIHTTRIICVKRTVDNLRDHHAISY
jgi:hypothetical protein